MAVKAYILVDITTGVKTQEILDKLNSIAGKDCRGSLWPA